MTRNIEVVETVKDGKTHAHLTGLPRGYCKLYPDSRDDGEFFVGWYIRETQNHSRNGRRYMAFPSYEQALEASIKWAKRKAS